ASVPHLQDLFLLVASLCPDRSATCSATVQTCSYSTRNFPSVYQAINPSMPHVGHYIYTIAFAGHQQFIQGWGINSGGRDLSRIWFGGKIDLNRSHRILFLAGAITE